MTPDLLTLLGGVVTTLGAFIVREVFRRFDAQEKASKDREAELQRRIDAIERKQELGDSASRLLSEAVVRLTVQVEQLQHVIERMTEAR